MKKALSLILALVLCLSLCACGNKITPEMIDAYKNANACLSLGRYAEAAKLYLKSGKYKDTDAKLREIYYYAVNCYEEGNIEEARALFAILKEAEVNDSAEYSMRLENHASFVDAMNHAKESFEELHDIHSGYEWLDKAATYAVTQQQAEIDAYRQEIAYVIYADTAFVSFDAFLSQKKAVTETTDGNYSCYSYRLNGHNYEEAHDEFKAYYAENYTAVTGEQIPQWIYNIVPKSSLVYYDVSGNLLAWDYSLIWSTYVYTNYPKQTTEINVYVFYADYVDSMGN